MRIKVLHGKMSAVLIGSLLASLMPGGILAAEGQPLFRFVHLTDIHISSDDNDTYLNARAKAEAAIRAIATGKNDFRPDFALATGDIAHGDKMEKLEPDNAAAAELFRKLGVPVMVTPGNHEILQGEGISDLEAGYIKAFGIDTTTYAVQYCGVLFVMINDAGGMTAGTPAADRRNQAVAEILDSYPGVPKIVACHIPLVPLRDEKILEASFGFSTYKLIGDAGLLEIIERHRQSVIAVISGHLHLTGHVVVNGIHHITAAGTASYPNHYGEYTVYSDRIDVRMRQIPAHLVVKFASGVHGRKGIQYTDSSHPTHDEYVSGLADEQRFSIRLEDSKQMRPEPGLLALNPEGWVAPYTRATQVKPKHVRVENLGYEPRIVRLPLPGGAGSSAVVGSTEGDKLYLSPTGQAVWSKEELRAGVPVLLPPRGAVELMIWSRAQLPGSNRINTAELLERNRLAIEITTHPAVKRGMRFWSDRNYVVDVLPDELIGLQPILKRCHQREITVERKTPGRIYAVFLPYQGMVPKREELELLGWKLFRAAAFNGSPFPSSSARSIGEHDIYFRDLEAGKTPLAEPRQDEFSAWALLGMTEET